jgi:hypothetical protein
MKKLTLQILLLTTSIYSIAGDPQVESIIPANREIPWTEVLDAIQFTNANLSKGLKALSDHIIEKYIDQKPLLLTTISSEETLTYTVNLFSTDPQTSEETKKTVLMLKENRKNNLLSVKSPFLEEKGISCSIGFTADPSKNVLNTSINFTFEPKAKLFFDNIEKKFAQVNR